jgi:para-nitrobenzyl esterase
MHMPSAKGLFHRAIAESGGSAAYLTVDESLRIADLTLKNLGLAGTEVHVLKTLPYGELLEAADAALDQVSKEAAGSGRSLSWRPVLDGTYIESEYSDFTAGMPLIAGTNFSERSSTFAIGDGRKNFWSDEETYANLEKRYGRHADQIVAEFGRLFPYKKTADAYFYAPQYRTTVRGVLDGRLNSRNTGPVYNYLFAYEAPVNGGITPFHCAELIYVFHNVDMPSLRRATGGALSAHKMQNTVASAWVNFAAAGNPSQDGLEWRPYRKGGNGTMVFDTVSEFKTLDDQKLVELMSR